MGSCYAKKFVDICRNEWDYQCDPNKWNKYADDLDKVDYFTGCGPKQNLDFCAVGLCWAMWQAIIDPDCIEDPEAAKWAAHYFMYQSDSCDTAAVVKYLYQFFADNGATTDNPERGDIVIFQKNGNAGSKIMYHCGAVTDWDYGENSIEVTEFNTEGGKVKPHYYKFGDIGGKIKCFCRPRYDGWEYPTASAPAGDQTDWDAVFTDLARRCYRGEFGNGLDRKHAINGLGYGNIFSEVQKRVNLIVAGRLTP